MSTPKRRPLRIATLGLGEQMNNALHMFFKGPCQNTCALAPEESAELSIVDLDGYNGTQQLEDHLKNFPQRPIIVLSLHEKVFDGTIFLRKPVKLTQLFEAIKQAKEQLLPVAEKSAQERISIDTNTDSETVDESVSADTVADRSNKSEESLKTNTQDAGVKRTSPSTHRAAMYLDERSANTYIGSALDIDPENQQQIANAQYNPENFFQGYLIRAYSTAKSKGCSVIVECPQGSITISPTTGAVLNISEQKLRSLSTVPIIEGSLSLTLSDRDEQAADNNASRMVDSEGLIWKTALWASRGRVPEGTSFMTPVVIRRWPNLTRLMVFPHALRVAALWSNKPYTLVNTAKYLDIPQRNVFAFYSAAHAIGLVTMAEGNVASLIESQSSATHGQKGLLNRIINRLNW